MTKIYLIESSSSLGVFHREVFTNRKKAEAYKRYYDLKNVRGQLGEKNQLYELEINNLNWSEDYEQLLEEIPY